MAWLTSLKRLSQFVLGLLVLEYVSGFILNLFVTLPNMHSGQNGNFFARNLHAYGWAITVGGGALLFLHVVVATALVVGSVIFVVQALRSHQSHWVWVSSFGLLGILAAFTNGLSFLNFGHRINAFIMGAGFITAAASYAAGLMLGKKVPVQHEELAEG